jgi:predicted transposase/invertase (TIGR01784 family)
MSTPSIDHDKNFKELIATFFLEFLELFLPEIAQTIEPDSIKFLQQEYFVDLAEGEEKIIDLLAEVKQAGEDATFLIHVEPQATGRLSFPQRLFFYFALLHQKHLKRIYPIAIFSYDKPKKESEDSYIVEFPDRKILEFNFLSIQLNRLDWRDFIDQPNPVAAALMSKMNIAKQDRPKVKAECLRLLVTLKLDPAKSRLISKFVDTYLRLNESEEKTFQTEIATMSIAQKEEIMEVTTSWEEKGIEKERRAIALEMLQENLPLDQVSRLTKLTIAQIKKLQSEKS